MSDVLVVVDMQNDFITEALGTEEAKSIVPNVVKKIKEFEGAVIYTRDTHNKDYLETQEGKNLPVVHCVKGTYGWELEQHIQLLAEDADIVDKPTFGAVDLPNVIRKIVGEDNLTKIEVVGLCTDICVISNVMILKAAFPEVRIVVDSSCCAGVTVESHKNALEAMKMCQVEIIS